MPWKLYADTRARRTRQVVADAGMVVWTVLWLVAAVRIHSLIAQLAQPGYSLAQAGDALSANMVSAGDRLSGLPVLGDAARAPFDQMGDAGQVIADSGRDQAELIGRVAVALAVALFVVAVGALGAVWLPLRVRFARRAGAAQRFIDSPADLDLLALRALARQPIHVLARLDPDPAGRWRRADPEMVRALAELELRDEGLHLPEGAAPFLGGG